MIGNDVIDLALARSQSNWKRRGFVDKLFTENEKALISEAPDPEIAIWSLWSRKEAVYKIYNRQTGIRAFIPLKINCIDENTVVCGLKKYHTKTEINLECIHSIAVPETGNLSQIITLGRKEIFKRDSLPFSKNGYPASVSHHGRFEKIVGIRI